MATAGWLSNKAIQNLERGLICRPQICPFWEQSNRNGFWCCISLLFVVCMSRHLPHSNPTLTKGGISINVYEISSLHWGKGKKSPTKQPYCTTEETFWTCGVYSVYSGLHPDLGLQNHMKLDVDNHTQKLHYQISSR